MRSLTTRTPDQRLVWQISLDSPHNQETSRLVDDGEACGFRLEIANDCGVELLALPMDGEEAAGLLNDLTDLPAGNAITYASTSMSLGVFPARWASY